MEERREITPEEWAEMLAWLRPRLSVGVSDNPLLRALSPQKLAEIVLHRLNAQHLTFMRNLEQLVRYRMERDRHSPLGETPRA
ncbi:MAG: hypothetical protein RMI80_11500 [Meiothermus sp.]|uniref:hypothetical protein n=1 Tax=Meiothermus sp. TaxID=1955249 RepID=UPI00298F170B|nr:hypothetical protein [Meiothermus sp.]MDW8092026.1 hypothetical protein [Meiothermus sp.]